MATDRTPSVLKIFVFVVPMFLIQSTGYSHNSLTILPKIIIIIICLNTWEITVGVTLKATAVNQNSRKAIICDYPADKIVVVFARYFYVHEDSMCSMDVTPNLSSLCSGLHTCYIQADPVLLGTDFCREYAKTLVVKYYCKPWERRKLFTRWKRPTSNNSSN